MSNMYSENRHAHLSCIFRYIYDRIFINEIFINEITQDKIFFTSLYNYLLDIY